MPERLEKKRRTLHEKLIASIIVSAPGTFQRHWNWDSTLRFLTYVRNLRTITLQGY